MAKTILFSCVGTTDPVRGYRDGPLLHIMRHYRPDIVCLFISAEMKTFEEKDGRYQKTMDFVRSQWDGYEVEYIPFYSGIDGVHDLDKLAQPMYDAVDTLIEKYPEGELVLNLSSGTPQMQIIMMQIALDIHYRAKGVQVANPNKKAGTAPRTNEDDYDVIAELECNEDELPGSDDRTSEPEMITLQQEKQLDRIKALLDARNYVAIRSMKGSLPASLMTLVSHLAARSQLQSDEAQRLAKCADVPFTLYPINNVRDRSISYTRDYQEVSEYFLIIKNMMISHRYSDFVVRLNPLVIRLQCAALDKWLGFPLKDILQNWKGAGQKLSVSKLQQKDPQLCNDLNEKMDRPVDEDKNLSIYLCNRMLECLTEVPESIMSFFEACEKLNWKRNEAAHDLVYITDDVIKASCGMSSAKIVQSIQVILPQLYPECSPAIFDIYEKCNEYIMRNAKPLSSKRSGAKSKGAGK